MVFIAIIIIIKKKIESNQIRTYGGKNQLKSLIKCVPYEKCILFWGLLSVVAIHRERDAICYHKNQKLIEALPL